MTTVLPDPVPGLVAVTSLSRAKKHKRRFDAVLTLEDPRARWSDKLRFTNLPHRPQLVLAFEDVDDESFGFANATRGQVEQAIAFGREHRDGALLVHCFHGVGRSAACALAILADRAGPGAERATVEALLATNPDVTPNLIVVALADDILGRNGALVQAVSDVEAGIPAKAASRKARRELAEKRPELFARRTAA